MAGPMMALAKMAAVNTLTLPHASPFPTPTFCSVKDRIGFKMIDDAEKAGKVCVREEVCYVPERERGGRGRECTYTYVVEDMHALLFVYVCVHMSQTKPSELAMMLL